MIVSEQDALNRLASPLNLMNRLSSRRRDAMGLFGVNNKDKTVTTGSLPTTFNNPFKKESTALVPTTPSNPPDTIPTEAPADKEPNLDDLVGNANSQVKLGLAHDKALDTLVHAVTMMQIKLDDVKPDRLPSVIAATSKVVDQIQRQRIDANKARGQREVHFHFYTPTQKKVEDYDVIEVG